MVLTNLNPLPLLAGLWCATALSCAPSLGQMQAEAADRWERATGLRSGYWHAQPPRLVAEAGSFSCGGRLAMGCYQQRPNVLTVDVTLHPAHLEVVMLHEVGHYLGAGHGSGDDVMRPGVTMANACLTPQDVALVCGRRACTRRVPECGPDGER